MIDQKLNGPKQKQLKRKNKEIPLSKRDYLKQKIRRIFMLKNIKKIFILIFIIFCAGVSIFYLCQKAIIKKPETPEKAVVPAVNEVINSAIFNCADNKNIKAIFFQDKVELTLSDGRSLLLNQAISASGARYTNSDESFVFWNKGDTAFVEEKTGITFKDCVVSDNHQAPVQLANPASTNCLKLKGNLMMEKRADGGEYGLCYFEDNRACEEWALLRGDCPLGGVKTTGFDTLSQKYCAWSGGRTLAIPKSICTFKDGSQCSTEDFYQGTCSVGESKKHNLAADLYPLYSKLSWNKETATTTDIFGLHLSGFEIDSQSINDAKYFQSNISFKKYYDNKLLTSGWALNKDYEADGAGSSVWAYTKGSEMIILSYNSEAINQKPNEPLSCPCNMTFSIFSGEK